MCTNIYYKSIENHWYFGRTQEYADDTPINVSCVDSKTNIALSHVDFISKLKFGGVNFDTSSLGFETVLLLDGINEKGIAGATLAFPDYLCQYASKDEINDSGRLSLCSEEVVTWVLSQYGSIADIIENINKDVAVCKEPNLLNMNIFQHYMFSDSEGNCIVVEPTIYGQFEITSNPVGVMTNQPEFKWHLNNLQNYLQLENVTRNIKSFRDLKVPAATGSGLLGLPGDSTPQSRFVRAAVFVNFSDIPEDECAIISGFHILNNFDIPKGVVHNAKGKVQYTQYTSLYDLKDQEVSVKMYECLKTHRITLNFEKVQGIEFYAIK